jgi:hypothetical protein
VRRGGERERERERIWEKIKRVSGVEREGGNDGVERERGRKRQEARGRGGRGRGRGREGANNEWERGGEEDRWR